MINYVMLESILYLIYMYQFFYSLSMFTQKVNDFKDKISL